MDSCHLNIHSPDPWKLYHFNNVLHSGPWKFDYKNREWYNVKNFKYRYSVVPVIICVNHVLIYTFFLHTCIYNLNHCYASPLLAWYDFILYFFPLTRCFQHFASHHCHPLPYHCNSHNHCSLNNQHSPIGNSHQHQRYSILLCYGLRNTLQIGYSRF